MADAEAAPIGTAAASAATLRIFGADARLDEGIEADGARLTFPPRAAWLWVRVDAAEGSYRLDLSAEGPAALRAELVTTEGPFPLPMVAVSGGFAVHFALEAPVTWLRLAPVEAGAVRFTAFSLAAHPPWHSLLPDWRLGPLRLPISQMQAPPVPAAAAAPAPSWDSRLSITALENLAFEDGLADCGRCGAMRLAVTPPLGSGLHIITADFCDSDGLPAWVAPRLHLDGAAPNAVPAAHFRRRRGGRYVARLVLCEEAGHLVFQPRQERGTVRIEGLEVRTLGLVGRALSLAHEGWRALAPRLLAPLERLVGRDPCRDGQLAALLRLLTLSDLRYRKSLGRDEAERVRRWLARPVERDDTLRVFVGPGPAAERARTEASLAACGDQAWTPVAEPDKADVVVPAGARLVRHALAAVRRVPRGAPPAFDTDRVALGLRSAPHFRAPPPPADGASVTDIPLVLAHRPRRPTEWAANPRAKGAAPTVAIVTATKDAPQHLARFLATLKATGPGGAELILLDNASTDPEALSLLASAKDEPNVRVVRDDRPFNFAALSNLGAALANSEILIFANNDLEFRYAGWAQALIAALDVAGTGVAGGLLDYPDGRIQHAGIVLAGEARVRHLERFSRASDVGHFARRRGLTAVSAVTGALMAVRREDFRELGGFAAARYPVLYNDVDLCLRARRAGLGVVLASEARAVHHESVTFGTRRVRDLSARGGPLWRLERAEEADRFRQDWADLIDADPCYPGACDPVEAAFRATL